MKTSDANEREWVGGLAAMPAFVGRGEEAFRPDILLWIDAADGRVLGSTVERDEDMLDIAAARLQATILRPMAGSPGAPARLRVSDEALSDVLAAAFPDIDVTHGPTPEVDAVMRAMRRDLSGRAGKETSWLGNDVSPDAVAGLFDAAASLHEAAPWSVVPSDGHLLFLRIPALGTAQHVISTIGQRGESFGLVIFESEGDYDRYIVAADAAQRGEMADIPRHASLSFDPGAEQSRALRARIVRHGWRVAGADAYPELRLVEPDLLVRPIGDGALRLAEALARAVTAALATPAPWLQSWQAGSWYGDLVTVDTGSGALEVLVATGSVAPTDPSIRVDDVLEAVRMSARESSHDPAASRTRRETVIERRMPDGSSPFGGLREPRDGSTQALRPETVRKREKKRKDGRKAARKARKKNR